MHNNAILAHWNTKQFLFLPVNVFIMRLLVGHRRFYNLDRNEHFGSKKDEGWWYPYLKSTNGTSDFSRIACSHSYNMMGTHEKLGSRLAQK